MNLAVKNPFGNPNMLFLAQNKTAQLNFKITIEFSNINNNSLRMDHLTTSPCHMTLGYLIIGLINSDLTV